MIIHDNTMHPGQVIDTLLIQEGQMTQQSLADALNVSRKTVNSLIRGNSGLTADMAVRLEKITLVPADAWLDLQVRCDVLKARQKLSQNPVSARLRPLPVAKQLTRWRSMTPVQRDLEKQSQREADFELLEAGKKTPAEINQENAFLSGAGLHVELPFFVKDGS